MDYNDIFEPNHFDSENIKVESFYDMDSDASITSSSASSTSSVSSVSTQKSNALTQSKRKSIPWVETHSFKDLCVADAYVSELTSTRDSSKPLCIFFDKLTKLKHKMLQQTRICFDKLINQYSVQPKEFCFYRPPTYEMIVKGNDILVKNKHPFTNAGINSHWLCII